MYTAEIARTVRSHTTTLLMTSVSVLALAYVDYEFDGRVARLERGAAVAPASPPDRRCPVCRAVCRHCGTAGRTGAAGEPG